MCKIAADCGWGAFIPRKRLSRTLMYRRIASGEYIDFRTVPKKFHTYEMYTAAVKANGKSIKTIPKPDQILCNIAVESNILAYKHIPKQFITHQLSIKAVKGYMYLKGYLRDRIPDESRVRIHNPSRMSPELHHLVCKYISTTLAFKYYMGTVCLPEILLDVFKANPHAYLVIKYKYWRKHIQKLDANDILPSIYHIWSICSDSLDLKYFRGNLFRERNRWSKVKFIF
jgi:hypothetical protein